MKGNTSVSVWSASTTGRRHAPNDVSSYCNANGIIFHINTLLLALSVALSGLNRSLRLLAVSWEGQACPLELLWFNIQVAFLKYRYFVVNVVSINTWKPTFDVLRKGKAAILASSTNKLKSNKSTANFCSLRKNILQTTYKLKLEAQVHNIRHLASNRRCSKELKYLKGKACFVYITKF
jgi:hypothetical protein